MQHGPRWCSALRWKLTDLAGEVMVNRQAQRLFLQGNKDRRALLAARNFPLGSPQTRTDRHAAAACGGHGAPDALPPDLQAATCVVGRRPLSGTYSAAGRLWSCPPERGAPRAGRLSRRSHSDAALLSCDKRTVKWVDVRLGIGK